MNAITTQGIAPVAELVPLHLIDPDVNQIRRTPPGELEQAQLRDNIAQLGILQPVQLRPSGDRYVIVAGARRVQAARDLGLKDVPAVVRASSDADAAAIQASENCHRADMDPIDIWQAMVRLQETGLTLQAAGQVLRLTDRRARQLDRLGRIAPEIIERMRTDGVPHDMVLAVIAAAPLDAQAKAFRKLAKKARGHSLWSDLHAALRVRRFSMADAIFDTDKADDVHWQEDVFAEPGSRNAVTTGDVDNFLKHQRAALEARVAKRRKKGERVEFAEQLVSGVAIPAGYQQRWDIDQPRSMKLPPEDPRLLLLSIDPLNGCVRETLVIQRGKKVPTAAPAAPPTMEHEAPEDDGATDADDAGKDQDQAAETPKPGMTQAGREMLAGYQTQAIRARLERDGEMMRPTLVLALLCAAICGENVQIEGCGNGWQARGNFADLARELVRIDGSIDEQQAKSVALRMLQRMVLVGPRKAGRHTGPLAPAIGRAISANETLPAFDDAAFLATLSATTLRDAGAACGITGVKTAKGLRERLAGQIGTRWVPPGAEFTPTPRAELPLPAGHGHQAKPADEDDAGDEA